MPDPSHVQALLADAGKAGIYAINGGTADIVRDAMRVCELLPTQSTQEVERTVVTNTGLVPRDAHNFVAISAADLCPSAQRACAMVTP